jgi:hypothetical protein
MLFALLLLLREGRRLSGHAWRSARAEKRGGVELRKGQRATASANAADKVIKFMVSTSV